MTIIKEITIDILNSGLAPRVYAMQGDAKSRAVKIHLKSNGQAWSVPEGAEGIVRYSRQNGNGSSYDTTPSGLACVFGESDVTVYLSQNLMAVSGLASVSVDIQAEESNLHTFVFELMVEKNPGIVQGEDGGYYLAGALKDSGWTPNMFLGTDGDGNVVTKAAPGGGGATDEQVAAAVEAYMEENPVEAGATAEQAAQIQANAEAIADIRDPVVSGNTHWEENTATVTMALASGGSDVIKAEFDDNANLTKITVNGREIPWTTTGV